MWEWNPQTGQYLWKVLVLALPGGVERAFHGTPPSDQLLNRMFGPVVDIDKVEPNKDDPGGLAISHSGLMRSAKWQLWAGRPVYKPVRDGCS